MDDKVVDLIIDRIKSLETNVNSRFDNLEDQMTDIQKTKWKALGAATVIGFAGAIAFEVIKFFMFH